MKHDNSIKKPVVWLVGHPNSGKTLLFNTLTGLSSRVANYPGITVEYLRGQTRLPKHGAIELIDLPGTYSLCARSEDESLAIKGIFGNLSEISSSGLLLAIADANNLERSLYFIKQLRELGLPMVVALSFTDMLKKNALSIDTQKLSEQLGVRVVAISSVSLTGIKELLETLDSALSENPQFACTEAISILPSSLTHSVRLKLQNIGLAFAAKIPRFQQHNAVLFENLGLLVHGCTLADCHRTEEISQQALRVHSRLSPEERDLLTGVVTNVIKNRHEQLAQMAHTVTRKEIQPEAGIESNKPLRTISKKASHEITHKADKIFLNPVLGPLSLMVIFFLLFSLLFEVAEPAIAMVEHFQSMLAQWVTPLFEPNSLLLSLVTDGIIAGVGSVLSFVPPIAILFAFIFILEDSGYMARATFLLDRAMARFGLSGRAFVPLLSAFACAVPAIMSTRIIESKRSRIAAIMITPFMSCSARLPVYGLLIAAVFSSFEPVGGFIKVGSLIMIGMYGLGIFAAVIFALIFKYVLKLQSLPLILELPPYRMPRWKSLFSNVWSRIAIFLSEAGTLILALTIVLWALFTFPQQDDVGMSATDKLKASYAGQIGQIIEPVIAPLGFDWKMGIGLIASFAAREVFVPTLGVVYGLQEEATEESSSLRAKIAHEINPATGKPAYSPLVALSLMAFFALSMQCMSTLAATRKETRSYGWPLFQFAYMSLVAWLCSCAIFNVGTWLGF